MAKQKKLKEPEHKERTLCYVPKGRNEGIKKKLQEGKKKGRNEKKISPLKKKQRAGRNEFSYSKQGIFRKSAEWRWSASAHVESTLGHPIERTAWPKTRHTI